MTPDYKRVYQGGHHDVWCDGIEHAVTDGGYCHDDKPGTVMPGRKFPCDCAYWFNRELEVL